MPTVNWRSASSDNWMPCLKASKEWKRMDASHKASPSNEQFLTDKEVSAWLKVSRRTLQDYRNNGMVSYYQLGGKILYKESDIERMVMSGYRNAYRLET